MAGRSLLVEVSQQLLKRTVQPRLKVTGVVDTATRVAASRAPMKLKSAVDAGLVVYNTYTIVRLRNGQEVHLNEEDKQVRKELFAAALKAGIKGVSLANLLATVESESGFKCVTESCAYTPARAREMFSTLRRFSDAQILALCQKPVAFFETVYGHETEAGRRLGNTEKGDGYRFRGRGVFQLTGRSNYEAFAAASGHWVLLNPDSLVNDLEVSIEAAIWFWKTRVMAAGADRDIVRATKIVNPYLADIRPRVASASKYLQAVSQA